jgi:hypothetical protein
MQSLFPAARSMPNAENFDAGNDDPIDSRGHLRADHLLETSVHLVVFYEFPAISLP